MGHPHFYYTWTAQREAPEVEFLSTDEFSYTIKMKREGRPREIIDLSSLSFQASLGMRPESLKKALERQYPLFPMAPIKATWEQKEKVSLLLKKVLKLPEGKIFYCLSGAEAIENALKMARQISGRQTIASRQRSYHGATLGAISISGDWRNSLTPTTDHWVLRLPEPEEDPHAEKSAEAIARYGPQKIAAICLETISGSNGVAIPPPSYYRGIQKICRDHSLFLILDEVTCGFGRTGKNMGFHHYDIQADFIAMAKGLTAGVFPMGALWTAPTIADYYQEQTLPCGLTHYAHPLGLAAIEEVCTLLEQREFREKWQQGVSHFHGELHRQLAALPGVETMREIGMLAAIDLTLDGPSLHWEEALSFGFSAFMKPRQIILAPPLTIPHPLLTEGLKRLAQYLQYLENKERAKDE